MSKEIYTTLSMGKTGVGKSTTVDELFGLKWETDPSIPCTKKPQIAVLNRSQHPVLPRDLVRVVDMPGIGESVKADKKYFAYYKKWVPKAHSLLWITQADTRGYKRDQLFLLQLIPLFKSCLHFIVAINHIDRLGVNENEQSFDINLRKPSEAQMKQLDKKIDDVYYVFKDVIKDSVVFSKTHIVPYTAVYGWELETLKKKLFLGR